MQIRMMQIIKFFFAAEIVICAALYFVGPRGKQQMAQYKQEIDALNIAKHNLEVEIGQLENELVTWENNLFFKEKIAREQLQMARKDETVYYLT